MKKYLILPLLLIISNIPVLSAEWREITPKRYIDISSYQHLQDNFNTARYTFWEKSLNDGTKYFKDIEKLKNKKVWYTMTRLGIDCESKTISVLDNIHYDLSGQVITSNSYPVYTGWTSIVPETLGDLYYLLLCKPN